MKQHFFQNLEGWFSFPQLYKYAVQSFPYGKFVEIGTWLGQSAAYMAVEIANSKKNIDFYCVDTWSGSEEHQQDQRVKEDKLYQTFLSNISPVSEHIIPIRMSSEQASRHFKDESLDFVFIDANHEYEEVKKDIEVWYPKVKKGGIFAGHDYSDTWEGVVKAVNEWVVQNNIILNAGELCWITRK
jgi:predicted O-methyltransferase YrrM